VAVPHDALDSVVEVLAPAATAGTTLIRSKR